MKMSAAITCRHVLRRSTALANASSRCRPVENAVKHRNGGKSNISTSKCKGINHYFNLKLTLLRWNHFTDERHEGIDQSSQQNFGRMYSLHDQYGNA